MTLGVIPSLAPYVLPKVLPALQRRYPELRIELRETQTKFLLEELARGSLDVVMLALPVTTPRSRRIRLFEDPFLFAVPATDRAAGDARVSAPPTSIREQLILLEEGHCLRDQALAYCAAQRTARRAGSGLGRHHQPRNRDADGGERLRSDAGAAGCGRRRSA